MSDDNEKLKVHIHYGGLMSKEGNKLCYRGGSIAPDMLVDPDFLTFSIFEDFKKKGEELTDVEKLWYRLPNEELSEARSIWHEKDKEIMKMASEAKECREVYVYVEYSVSKPAIVADGANLANVVRENEGIDERLDDGDKADDEYGSEDENRDEEEESEQSDGEERDEDSEEEDKDEERLEETRQEEIIHEEGGVQSEDENQILGEGGGDDPRFESLFALAEETPIVRGETTQPNVNDEDSDVEAETTLSTGEYPDSPEDTDEEWANWQKKDDRGRPLKRGKSKSEYDKPPYLWLMQTFSNGDEFKDQLLRYVLKTQYDVKLNKWQTEKLAAVCTHEKCSWRIYCSLEKPIRKWMVKVFENKHNHLPTGRARMLKQGTIARLFKEEARRRPN